MTLVSKIEAIENGCRHTLRFSCIFCLTLFSLILCLYSWNYIFQIRLIGWFSNKAYQLFYHHLANFSLNKTLAGGLCEDHSLLFYHVLIFFWIFYLPLESWKAGRFGVASILLTVRPMMTCDLRVSRAPPHHTLSAFLNIHGRP